MKRNACGLVWYNVKTAWEHTDMLNGDDRSGKGLFTADSGFGGGDLFFVYANMPFGCHFAAPQFVCFFIFEKTLLRQRHLGKMSAVTPAFARAHKKKKK